MKVLILTEKNGSYQAVTNIKSDTAMLQVNGATTLDLWVSVDGETYILHTSGISISDPDIINLVNCRFMMFLKVVSTNNVDIKLL